MAFQNTSERYQYIYGNNVKKLDEVKTERERDIHGSVQGTAALAPERKPVTRTVRRPRPKKAKKTDFDKRYTVSVVFAVLICVLASVFYITGTVRVNQMNNEITQLKSERSSLESKKIALQSEIDNSVNIDKIKSYAEKKLNMVVPSSSKILYYNNNSSDYFRQYESVDTE